ncbi:hypothetical protein E3U43_006143 [Larimichthys crocea]|uniref:Uncharacterized protein n=1 Tax=Larimichthys crocea TaxID=215358 RepID=A0ACD3QNH9_LARCR|nr:hypothetical protein E3U43_006143 [Larimichthys crocea]
MRYICNSLVKRARSAHNSQKFVSMLFFHHLKLCNHLKKEKKGKQEGAAFPPKVQIFTEILNHIMKQFNSDGEKNQTILSLLAYCIYRKSKSQKFLTLSYSIVLLKQALSKHRIILKDISGILHFSVNAAAVSSFQICV